MRPTTAGSTSSTSESLPMLPHPSARDDMLYPSRTPVATDLGSLDSRGDEKYPGHLITAPLPADHLRPVWRKPIVVAVLVCAPVAGLTIKLRMGWTSFGADASHYAILLDVIFSALGVLLVKLIQSAYTGYVSEYRIARGRDLGEQHSQFYAAQACHWPLERDYWLFWVAYGTLLVLPFTLYAGAKAASHEYQGFGSPVARTLQIDGVGGCDGTKCVMVSNELFVNVTRESTVALPAGRYAAPISSLGSSYFMPLWPAELFSVDPPAAHGDYSIVDQLGARYDFDYVRASVPHDVVRTSLCLNPITLNETDSVGMNVTIQPSLSATPQAYSHLITLCLRDLDQNNVFTSNITFSLGRTTALWRRDEAGNSLKSVQGFRGLEPGETVGDWHLDKPTTELALTFRNTLVWYQGEDLTSGNIARRTLAVQTAVHAYAQSVLMRSAQPGATVYNSYLAPDVTFTPATRGFQLHLWFAIFVWTLVGGILVVSAVLSFFVRPYLRGDIGYVIKPYHEWGR